MLRFRLNPTSPRDAIIINWIDQCRHDGLNVAEAARILLAEAIVRPQKVKAEQQAVIEELKTLIHELNR